MNMSEYQIELHLRNLHNFLRDLSAAKLHSIQLAANYVQRLREREKPADLYTRAASREIVKSAGEIRTFADTLYNLATEVEKIGLSL